VSASIASADNVADMLRPVRATMASVRLIHVSGEDLGVKSFAVRTGSPAT
jgi:hypothetical protein